jgi:hypothetical protein
MVGRVRTTSSSSNNKNSNNNTNDWVRQGWGVAVGGVWRRCWPTVRHSLNSEPVPAWRHVGLWHSSCIQPVLDVVVLVQLFLLLVRNDTTEV